MTTTPTSDPLAPAYARAFHLPACPTWRPLTVAQEAPTIEAAPLWGTLGGYITPPAIGARVLVTMNGFGPATVEAYCVQDGYLGVHVRPDARPAWHRLQAPDRHVIVVFGNEIKPEPFPTAGKVWLRAYADAAGWRARRGRKAAVTDRIVFNHYGLSRDAGHLGAVTIEHGRHVRELYAQAFKIAAFVPS